MHVKICTLHADIALEVAEVLRDAGIKTELKPHFDVEMEEVGYIEGKLGELIERYSGTEYEEDVRDWEEYLNAAREILSSSEPMSVDDFISSFVTRFVDGDCDNLELEEVINSSVNRICEERGISVDELGDEERAEILREAFYRSRDTITESIMHKVRKTKYEYIATKILESSGVAESETVERIADDPELVIRVDVDDAERAEELGVEIELEVSVAKRCDVYANVIDAIYEREKLLKIVDELDEVFKLLIVADIAAATYRHLQREGKMGVDEVVELLEDFELDERIGVSVDEEAAKELLKLLEREKFIKIKRGEVKARG